MLSPERPKPAEPPSPLILNDHLDSSSTVSLLDAPLSPTMPGKNNVLILLFRKCVVISCRSGSPRLVAQSSSLRSRPPQQERVLTLRGRPLQRPSPARQPAPAALQRAQGDDTCPPDLCFRRPRRRLLGPPRLEGRARRGDEPGARHRPMRRQPDQVRRPPFPSGSAPLLTNDLADFSPRRSLTSRRACRASSSQTCSSPSASPSGSCQPSSSSSRSRAWMSLPFGSTRRCVSNVPRSASSATR
jgi:hypothetical protein